MDKVWNVVKIIDDYKIVINGGSQDLLKKGDELEIYVEGEEVIDPITKKSLGTLDGIKAYITIMDLFENMSVCRNTETRAKNLLEPIYLDFDRPNRFKVNPKEITGYEVDFDKTIEIGDFVRKSR